ncbi:MAG: NADH-quinone oxidoreductase subunit C [Bacteroidia bacterium]|nr:MAG: NADH-quinone oxidoreductase subunit C [Bacteroidia bacterium]
MRRKVVIPVDEKQQEFLESLKADLMQQFPDGIVSAELPYNFPTITVKHNVIKDVLIYLKESEKWNFFFLTDLTGIQTPDEQHLGVIYHLHNMITNQRIRVKTFFGIDKPEVPTVTDLWKTANWMERETYDFFGIVFKGHPDLRRILNPDEMDIFPLRKEYPVEDQTREDKDDTMFGR